MDQSTLIKVMNYGALKYSPEKICVILGFDEITTNEFMLEFQDQKSTVRKSYNRGVLIGEYNVDAELAKQSEKGDIFSIQQLREIQDKREVSDLINKLFGV